MILTNSASQIWLVNTDGSFTLGWQISASGRVFGSTTRVSSENVNIAAEHQEPAEVLSQLDNTSNSPVYGEYKCC